MAAVNSFGSKDTLSVGGVDYAIHRIDKVPGHEKLPYSLKVLLENLLRTEDGANVTEEQIRALGSWRPGSAPTQAASLGRLLVPARAPLSSSPPALRSPRS